MTDGLFKDIKLPKERTRRNSYAVAIDKARRDAMWDAVIAVFMGGRPQVSVKASKMVGGLVRDFLGVGATPNELARRWDAYRRWREGKVATAYGLLQRWHWFSDSAEDRRAKYASQGTESANRNRDFY